MQGFDPRSEVTDDDFFRDFDEVIYEVSDCLWDGTSKYAYWHDKLSDHEIDLLCGVYHVGTGQKKTVDTGQKKPAKGKRQQGGHRQPDKSQQVDTDQASIVSWWPKPSAWARGGLDGSWWTPQCEDEFFAKGVGHFENKVYILRRQGEWRHNLKYYKEVKKCWDGYEVVADSIVQALISLQAP
ncbi:hypothetical protein B0H19DRAFT_1262530 [Mycena capillaripes]|nr:hypothetical protein B0H19DRAFT_1262530 [Mycena capillaripes]